jgi:pathogenesis-related protein 1
VTRVFAALFSFVLLASAESGRSAETYAAAPMAEEMLRAHNAVRSRARVPPLAWSETLASYAQAWADQLAREHRLRHHSKPVYGENLYLIERGRAAPAAVVASWAAEASHYNYRRNSCRGHCGHYTQIVWNATRQVGCAQAVQGSTQMWVCEYNPPGNIVGERPY